MKLHNTITEKRLVKCAYLGKALCICCGRDQTYRPSCFGCGDSRVFGPAAIYEMMIGEAPMPVVTKQAHNGHELRRMW